MFPVVRDAFLPGHVFLSEGTPPMEKVVFTCPVTRLSVQHWLDEAEAVLKDEYVGIQCQACTKLHFINKKTGKLLGQK
jgi:hypothetical protein